MSMLRRIPSPPGLGDLDRFSIPIVEAAATPKGP